MGSNDFRKKKKKLFEPTLNKSHDYVISTLFSLPAQRSSTTTTTSTASTQPQRCLNLNHNHHHHNNNNNHNSDYDHNPTMVSLSGFFSFFIYTSLIFYFSCDNHLGHERPRPYTIINLTPTPPSLQPTPKLLNTTKRRWQQPQQGLEMCCISSRW